MKWLIFLLLLSGVVNASGEISHLVNGCRIFTLEGMPVKTFPGDMCLFFNDGSFVTANDMAMRKFSSTDKVQWEIPGYFHHQLELDQKGVHILALGSEIRNKIKYDSFSVIDLNGSIVKKLVSSDLYTQAGLKPEPVPVSDFLKNKINVSSEIGHFNSFYEIPVLNPGKYPEYMKAGNFIVNALSDGIFIISDDLKKNLHHRKIPHSFNHQIHDVQVTKNGEFLLFNNRGSEGGPVNRYSAIQKIDHEGKVRFSYTSQPREFFYSHSCGGVQELGADQILFSDVLSATYFYDLKKGKLLKAVTGTHRNSDRPWNSPTQRVKGYDLRSFLSSRSP